MLHFFNPNRTMSNFDAYVSDLEEKRSKELNREFKFSEDEKRQMLLQYQAKENHYITDYALDFEGIGQVGTFDTRYVTNTSNQLCAMVTTPKEISNNKFEDFSASYNELIFDRFSIKEKMKDNKLEQKQNYDEDERF